MMYIDSVTLIFEIKTEEHFAVIKELFIGAE